jgi:ABC-type sugar transport system ATPase subunit
MAAIALRGVSTEPRPGGFALHDIDLVAPDGEVCGIIGPSGSGKSTLLRVVAGLEPVAAGTVHVGAADVTELPAAQRGLAWSGQDQTLYPHLSVEGNIGFALRLRRMLRRDLDERVRAEARVAHIERLLPRMPDTLSAGERQATNLARVAARTPKAYLLDEPLARIDARERARLRSELARRFAGVDVAVLLATNDQADAFSLSDLLVVLEEGRVLQQGPPQFVYRQPVTVSVATFVGEMNLLAGVVEVGSRASYVRVGDAPVLVTDLPAPLRRRLDARPVLLGVRPERLSLGGSEAPLAAVVHRVEVLGSGRRVHATLPDGAQIVAQVRGAAGPRPGETVRFEVGVRGIHLFDPNSETALWHATDSG